jgi:hypothetical protein
MGVATTSVVAGDDIVEEPEVIQGHPLLRAPGDVSLTRQWAQPTGRSSKHRRCFDESVETSMMSASASYYGIDAQGADNLKKAKAQAKQWHLNMREELLERQWAIINELDAVSQKVLSDTKELYASAEAWANSTIK